MALAVAPGLSLRVTRAGNLVFLTQLAGTTVGIIGVALAVPRAGADAVAWVLVLQALAVTGASWAAYSIPWSRAQES